MSATQTVPRLHWSTDQWKKLVARDKNAHLTIVQRHGLPCETTIRTVNRFGETINCFADYTKETPLQAQVFAEKMALILLEPPQ